ncbi:hypothetical protein [Pararoseomonas baculiformis]|uniref:hypothetical protein n=1 Tax=Pararoseomonas baculiformis TaxID=2820812 RepID=UPI001ADF5000|nr:hypothetical protein [Pararoseomonas baculiformis]
MLTGPGAELLRDAIKQGVIVLPELLRHYLPKGIRHEVADGEGAMHKAMPGR